MEESSWTWSRDRVHLGRGLDLAVSGWGPIEEFCEYGNELLGYMKTDFLDK
jgi:hypothetical protein